MKAGQGKDESHRNAWETRGRGDMLNQQDEEKEESSKSGGGRRSLLQELEEAGKSQEEEGENSVNGNNNQGDIIAKQFDGIKLRESGDNMEVADMEQVLGGDERLSITTHEVSYSSGQNTGFGVIKAN